MIDSINVIIQAPMDIGEIVGSNGSIALKGFGHLDYDRHCEVSLGSSFRCRAGIKGFAVSTPDSVYAYCLCLNIESIAFLKR